MIIPFIAGILLLGILIPMFKKELGFISRNFSKEKTVKIVTVTTEEKKKDTPATETTKKVEEVKKVEPVKVIKPTTSKIQFLGLLLILTAVILYTLYTVKWTAPLYYGWSGVPYFWILILVIIFGILVLTFTKHSIIGILLIVCTVLILGSNTKRVYEVTPGAIITINVPEPLQKSYFRAITNGEPSYLIRYNDEKIWHKKNDSFTATWSKLYKITIHPYEKGQITQEFRYQP